MLLFLSNRVLVGEPCLVSGGELMVVVEASFQLREACWLGVEGCGGLSERCLGVLA